MNALYRFVRLQDSADFQTCTELALSEVPPLSDNAVVVRVTPRSVRYDDGQESWFTDPRNKRILRAYRKKRDDDEIEAGAYPLVAVFTDGKGAL